MITACSITKRHPPTAPRPFYHEGHLLFQCEDFLVAGSATLGAEGQAAVTATRFPRTTRSAIGAGWRVAWIQLCHQEKVRGLYKGETARDGALLAEWPESVSFDTQSQDNSALWVSTDRGFYSELTASAPTATLEFRDAPQHYFKPSLNNITTGEPNVLAFAVVKLSFILALAAKDPEDTLYVLKHMTWGVQWESTFRGPADRLDDTAVPRRTRAVEGNPLDAAPPKLVKALGNPSRASSNVLAQECVVTPWRNWDALPRFGLATAR